MTATNFSEFDLDDSLLDALRDMGFSRPTAIQAVAIPRRWKDVTFWAQHRPEPVKPRLICCRFCSICWTFHVKIRPAAYPDSDPDPS